MTMTPDRIDESPNTNCLEGWQCPDCQSWGPFTVEVTTRVMLSDEGTHFPQNYGDLEYDDRSSNLACCASSIFRAESLRLIRSHAMVRSSAVVKTRLINLKTAVNGSGRCSF